MGQEDVEVVRGQFAAYANGGLDAVEAFWHEDIDWRAVEGAPDDVGEMRGTAAMRRYMQEWIDMFGDMTFEEREVRDLGDGRVVALQHISGKAKLSGAETQLDYAVLYWVRDGKVARGREYMTLEEALDAARSPG